MKQLKAWIEAMRLRTLPVSVAGVITAVGFNLLYDNFDILPAVICLLFAVAAQVASNFANEYFDYKAGRDKQGREGPRRGVTEGDITPSAMKIAIFVTLAIAGCLGMSLTYYGGLWLIAVGIAVALGVFAYSTGPYPLSTHGLGEVAVVVFFGLVPVNFTYYLQSLQWDLSVLYGSISIGLMGANVLIINNYRDVDDDRAVNKRTLAVRFGNRAMRLLYMVNAIVAVGVMIPMWLDLGPVALIIPIAYLFVAGRIVVEMARRSGAALTPLLAATSMAMFAYAVGFAVFAAFV